MPSNGVIISESSRSSLWDPTLREEISQLRKLVPDHEINNRRHQLLVPGSVLPLQPEEKPVPLLVINAPYEGDRKTLLVDNFNQLLFLNRLTVSCQSFMVLLIIC